MAGDFTWWDGEKPGRVACDPVAEHSGTLMGGRRAKWVVLALWVVLIGVFGPLGLKLPQVTNDEFVLPASSETAHVNRLLAARFPGGNQKSVLLVYKRDGSGSRAPITGSFPIVPRAGVQS
jgi:hypothetical protein